MDVVLLAAYRLPKPITASPRAVDTVYATRIGKIALDVLVAASQDPDPSLDRDNLAVHQDPSGPANAGVSLHKAWVSTRQGSDGSAPMGWHSRELVEGSQSVLVNRLLVRVHAQAPSPAQAGVPSIASAEDASNVVVEGIDQWYRIVRAWIEVYTTQDLDHETPRWEAEVQGAGLATFHPDGTRFPAPGRFRVTMIEEPPVSPELLAKAFFKAGAGELPPLHYLLLRDARAAWHRGHWRRAVIDACTACEVAMAPLRRSEGAPAKTTGGLGPLLKALEADGTLPPKLTAALRTHVGRVRNAAVHEAANPSCDEAAQALRVAEAALWGLAAPDGSKVIATPGQRESPPAD